MILDRHKDEIIRVLGEEVFRLRGQVRGLEGELQGVRKSRDDLFNRQQKAKGALNPEPPNLSGYLHGPMTPDENVSS